MSISCHKNGLVSSLQYVDRWLIFYVLCSENILTKFAGCQQPTCICLVKVEFVVGTIPLSCASVACRSLVIPGSTAWLDSRFLSSSLEQWRMVVLLLNLRYMWRHNVNSHSRFQTNVLAKFVDATCIFSESAAAVRQGCSDWVEGYGNFSKTKKKKLFEIMFVSVINSVDLKNNNKNYRKSFWLFWVPK